MKMTAAVISTDLEFAFPFLTNSRIVYTTYQLGVKGQVRRPANSEDDSERRMVEAKLFGAYGEEIRYAALSADGAGLRSYGALAIQLKDNMIGHRASLLEENSFDFVEHHDLLRRGSKIPHGFRSTWDERYKLAVAKLGGSVNETTSDDEFAGILLFSEGNRATDRFIEVHIHGSFTAKTVESVRGRSDTKDEGERADVARIKDALANAGKAWIEG